MSIFFSKNKSIFLKIHFSHDGRSGSKAEKIAGCALRLAPAEKRAKIYSYRCCSKAWRCASRLRKYGQKAGRRTDRRSFCLLRGNVQKNCLRMQFFCTRQATASFCGKRRERYFSALKGLATQANIFFPRAENFSSYSVVTLGQSRECRSSVCISTV